MGRGETVSQLSSAKRRSPKPGGRLSHQHIMDGCRGLWRGGESGGAVVDAHIVAELVFELLGHLVDQILQTIDANETAVDTQELKSVDDLSRELITDQRRVQNLTERRQREDIRQREGREGETSIKIATPF
jgi:hypothetical protein